MYSKKKAIIDEINNNESMLSLLPIDDSLGRYSIITRIELLKQQLDYCPDIIDIQPTSVKLLFGGKSVSGNYGIESSYAASILNLYSTTVHCLHINIKNGLVPLRGKLAGEEPFLLTNIVKGSFGFELVENIQQTEMHIDYKHSLKNTVEESIKLFSLCKRGEFTKHYYNHYGVRTIKTLIKLVTESKRNDSTFKITTDQSYVDINYSDINNMITMFEEEKQPTQITKKLDVFGLRILPTFRDGEFRFPGDDVTKKCKVDRTVGKKLIEEIDAMPANKPIKIKLLIKIYGKHDKASEKYFIREVYLR